MEKKFRTSYITSIELWTLDKEWPDDMEGIAPADHGAEKIGQARHEDILTTQWKDLDLDTYNAKHKSIWRKIPTPPWTIFLTE